MVDDARGAAPGGPRVAARGESPGRRGKLPCLVGIAGLAEHLGTSERHVRRLVAERRIPFLKVGRFVRFDPDEIAGWLERARVPVVARR
ncbi:MAG: helix-turn-helix domain-containing protein [Actinomycetota bacterium]|nr:helix-turn-helix domain-containing protein [Actinomycetota bacterium]